MPIINKEIICVRELLEIDNLTIPDYQRPYKWTARNIYQLFQDIDKHIELSAYRLGTVIFHKEEGEENLNIVDGQQRILTLILLVWALIEANEALAIELGENLKEFMDRTHFESEISHKNLHQNYLEIKRLTGVPQFAKKQIDFLLNKCQVVVITLNDISEAFQLFDSQNSRGRDLNPHDLLKAYHLREFSEDELTLQAEAVEKWESLDSEQLAGLFDRYLYRIRNWSLGDSARAFTKQEIDIFKGINLERDDDNYPYTRALQIIHNNLDEQQEAFPFHLDQVIINGRRFFEMIAYYQEKIEKLVSSEHKQNQQILGCKLSDQASNILKTLNSYPKRHRVGDQYTRTIFDCAVIFYWDKFGEVELSKAIEKLFIWAYSLRIRRQAVQLASIDNYVLENNVFLKMGNAARPEAILHLSFPILNDEENRNNRTEEDKENDPLVKLFKEMNYYE